MILKIFNCLQNFTFARFARKILMSARLFVLPKFLQFLICSLSCQYRKEVKDRPSWSPYAGLSLRAGGRGFSPATKRAAPGYFY